MGVEQREQGGVVQEIAQTQSILCETKTADYAVLASDAGKLLIANKAGTACAFTLPVVTVKGIWFFACLGATGMSIAGGTADKIVTINEADADMIEYTTVGEMIGAACIFVCDGVNYYHIDCCGANVTVDVTD